MGCAKCTWWLDPDVPVVAGGVEVGRGARGLCRITTPLGHGTLGMTNSVASEPPKPAATPLSIRITKARRALTPTEWNDVPPFAVIIGKNGVGKSQFLEELAYATKATTQSKKAQEIRREGEVLIQVASQDVYPALHIEADWSIVDKATGKLATWFAQQRNYYWSQYREMLAEEGFPPPKVLPGKIGEVFQRQGITPDVPLGRDEFFQVFSPELVTKVLGAPPGTAEAVEQVFAAWWCESIDRKLRDEPPLAGPAPWEKLNELLAQAGLKYTCTIPPDTISKSYLFQVRHNDTGALVDPANMSSGERVIFTLFLWIFSADGGRLPKLLLLDEPDAHLHPEMVRKFVRTVDDVLVKGQGMRVVMTTHSPTTVAVCREDALFEMLGPETPADQQRFRRISRDEAIGRLTAGVPALRISTENRRQVFVEDQRDERLFSALAVCLAKYLRPETGLAFIASGNRKLHESGGCTRVWYLVQQLAQAGNESVFGIVDWDKSANPSERIKVLAHNRRYSIENCIYDPLVLGAFMVKHRLIDESEFTSYVSLSSAEPEQWQRLVDYVTGQVCDVLNMGSDIERVPASPIDGPAVSLPFWYLTVQGHRLEDALRDAFPKLGAFWRDHDQDALMCAVVKHIGRDLPGLFPAELRDVLVEIQEHGRGP